MKLIRIPLVLGSLLLSSVHCGLAGAQTPPSFRDCDDVCPEMVKLPSGRFTMGSPESEPERNPLEVQHSVAIAKSFAIGKYDVTFAQWDACVADGGCNGYKPADEGWGRDNRPVINVNLADARSYAAWLTRKTGKAYRLLSEAEWEYAARGGTSTAYYWGDAAGQKHANCKGCGTEWDDLQSSPVGTFPPNPFGLYDMAGNVWSWIADCWNPRFDGAPVDGGAWETGTCSQHVLRGGAYDHEFGPLRAASRGGYDVTARDSSIGFRIARDF